MPGSKSSTIAVAEETKGTGGTFFSRYALVVNDCSSTVLRMIVRLCLPVLAALIGTGLIAACSGVPESPRAPGTQAPPPSAPPAAESRAGRQCLAGLSATGAAYSLLPDRYPEAGCSNVNTVQLSSVPSDGASLMIANLGPVTCEVSTAFAGWARYGVDRAAQQILGVPLRSIETFGSYSCRNVAGTNRRSAHSMAEAIDVSAFVLADGRRITLVNGWNGGSAAEHEFLRAVHRSACRRFSTVLGPEYNAAHRDHFHLEGVARGSSYCR